MDYGYMLFKIYSLVYAKSSYKILYICAENLPTYETNREVQQGNGIKGFLYFLLFL